MDRAASHRSSSKKKNVSNTISNRRRGGLPVTTMVGSEEESSSLNGGGGDRDTLTPTDPDPFAVLAAVDFTIPRLEMSNSTTPTPTTSDVRREKGWRYFEDYD